MAPAYRVLVVNPNTSPEVTAAFVAAAQSRAPDKLHLHGVTGQFGARIVSTEPDNLIAGHAVLDLIATHAGGYDAVILAISFDTGLAAAQALLPVPVVAITQASLTAAAAHSGNIGVVIFGTVSRGLYDETVARCGIRPVGVRSVEISSARDYTTAAAKDHAVVEACESLASDGAEAVVICGAAVAGIAARLQPRVAPRLFDGTEAVPACLAALHKPAPSPQSPPRPITGTTGLSPALTALLSRGTEDPT